MLGKELESEESLSWLMESGGNCWNIQICGYRSFRKALININYMWLREFFCQK